MVAGNVESSRNVVAMETTHKEIKDITNRDSIIAEKHLKEEEIRDVTNSDVVTMATSENEIKYVENGNAVIAETAQKEEIKHVANGYVVTMETHEEEIKDVTNDNIVIQDRPIKEDFGTVETHEKEIKDVANSDQSEKENEGESQEIGHVRLKTLADLIHICRDKGIQIYDDKPNIPEAERKRLDMLKEIKKQNGKNSKHGPDDPDSIKKQRRRSNANGGSIHSSAKSNYPKLGDWLDTQSRKTSAKSSMTGRSRATSRMSNITTSTERPVGSIDAEEWHQMRMRRKSRKRREMNGSLVDILKKKQEEVETISVKTLNTTENGERIDVKDSERKTKEHTEIKQDDNPNTDSAMTESDSIQAPMQLPSSNNSEKDLEEIQIKDGASTLVLYKVKENSKTSNAIKDSCPDDLKIKSHIMTPDNETKEMSQENDNGEKNINDETNSNVTELNKDYNEEILSQSTNGRSSSNTKQLSSVGTEKVKKEVRIQDGNSTLILYKVKDNAESPTRTTEKNKGLTKNMTDAPEKEDLDTNSADIIISSNKDLDGKSHRKNEGEKSIVRDADKSAVTPSKQVNNSDTSLNKSQRRSHNNKEHSVDKHANIQCGILDDTNGDMHSEKLSSTKSSHAGHTLNSVNMKRNSIPNGNIKRKNDNQASITDKNEHDTDDTKANIDRRRDTQIIHSNQENKSNTGQFVENDTYSDSYGEDTSKDRYNMIKDGDKDTTRSDSNKQHTGVNSDKKMKSVRTRKTPRRSLGNGFLVSSDTEDDNANVHPSKMTKSNPKPANENNNGDRKAATGRVHEPKKPMPQDSKGDKDTSNELKTGKTSRVSEVSNAGTSGNNSRTSSKFSQLSSQARMILLLTKVRQSNQQYGDEHSKTIDLLKETRLELRKDYKRFRNGLDIEVEVEEKEEEIVEEKEELVEEPVVQEENVTMVDEPEGPIEEPEQHEETEEEETDDDYEINVDVNGDILRAIKENASSKIDTKWRSDHPMFKKKKKGANREGFENKHRAKRKKTKKGTYFATNLPNENEYVREAKRIYLQGLESHGDDKKISRNKVITETHNSETISNKKTISVEESKQNSGKSETIPVEAKEEKDNSIGNSHSVQNNRAARMEQKKGKPLKNNTNTKNNDSTKETVKPSPHVKPGGKISLIPIKQKPKKEIVNEDNRLEIDRAFAKEYELYLKNKSALPKTRNNVHASRNKDESPKRNHNIKDLPNIDNGVGQREHVKNSKAYSDRWANDNENSEYDSHEKYESADNKTDSHSDKSGEDGSMSGAVDIVKSRSKFYNEVKNGSLEHIGPKINKLCVKCQKPRSSDIQQPTKSDSLEQIRSTRYNGKKRSLQR